MLYRFATIHSKGAPEWRKLLAYHWKIASLNFSDAKATYSLEAQESKIGLYF